MTALPALIMLWKDAVVCAMVSEGWVEAGNSKVSSKIYSVCDGRMKVIAIEKATGI